MLKITNSGESSSTPLEGPNELRERLKEAKAKKLRSDNSLIKKLKNLFQK